MGLASIDTAAAGLVVLALSFAWVNGVNDGGTLLVSRLRSGGIDPLGGVAVLMLALVAVPSVTGWRVAATLSERLIVDAGGSGPRLAVVTIVATVVVVAALGRIGAPTSLTLALIGALAGAGVGSGLNTDRAVMTTVVAMAALAPFVGMLVAALLARLVRDAGGSPRVRNWLHTGSRSSLWLQAIAYAANDGQKMLVVPILAGITSPMLPAGPRGAVSLAVALPFAAGAFVGVRRFSSTVGTLVRQAPEVTLVSSAASAGAVLGSAALGLPVSMTQTIAGAQIGAGMATGFRRIRWDIALRLAQAWVITLPAAFAAGAALGSAVIR